MTRVSELLEDEQLAHYERITRTFDRLDELEAQLAERAEQRQEALSEERHRERLWERQEQQRAAEQPQPPRRAPSAVRAPERNWTAEQRWIEGIIARKLESFAKGLAAEVVRIEREQLARVRRETEDRIARSDTATVELLMDLERRVAELERRAVPPKPRIVASGGSHAA